MQFLNPLIFFGLIALAIPVLIHLFNFRKPLKVFFTNVRFLRELKLQSKRKSQLKHLVVLMLRVLAFLAILIAFAMPVLRQNNNSPKVGKPLVVVWIDNSFSMQSLGNQGMLLEQAIKSASEIAGYYEPSDEFYLITNEFSSTFSRVVNKSDFLDLVTTVKHSPVSRRADEVLQRVSLLRKEHPNKQIALFVVSDFQSSTVQMTATTPDEQLEIYLLPVKPLQGDNLHIDSVWLEIPVIRPGQIADFNVRIGNTSSEEAADVPVTMVLNGRDAAVATATIPAEGKTTVKLTTRIAEEGFYHGTVSIEDQPVTFDDKFYIGFGVSGTRRVLALHSGTESPVISRLFSDDSLFFFQSGNATQIDFSQLSSFDVVFCYGLKEMAGGLTNALQMYVEGGGTLVTFPAMESIGDQSINRLFEVLNLARYGQRDTAEVRLGTIDFDHPVYKGVYDEKPANLAMPVVNHYLHLQQLSSAGERVVMKMINDRVMLLSSTAGKGMVYQFATSLDVKHSNLASHAEIFVPPFYNMALYSGVVPPLYYLIGADPSVSVTGGFSLEDNTLKVKAVSGEVEFIPGHRAEPFGYLLFFEDQIRDAGNFSVLLGEAMVAPLAFNFDQKESDLSVNDESDLKRWINDNALKHVTIISLSGKSVDEKLGDMHDGERLWRWFVLAALLFLALEAMLLRFWR